MVEADFQESSLGPSPSPYHDSDVQKQVVVEQNGRARRLAILRSVGYRGLDEAAIEQIGNRWKFKPATFEGKDIAILATIEVDYSIGSKVLSVPR